MFNRSKLWAAALLIAAFVAGAAFTWALDEWTDRGPGGRRRDTNAMIEFLDRRLQLRPAQRDSVRAVFVRYRTAMDSLWEAVHPRVDSVRSAMRAEIRALLDSAQAERYARLIARQRHHHHRPGGSDSGGRHR